MVPTLDAPAPTATPTAPAASPGGLLYPTLDELARLLPNEPETCRFLAKLRVGDVPAHRPELGPCLIWTAAIRNPDEGYGVFRGGDWMPRGSRLVSSHMWLYMRLHGPVPDGQELDHICHEPALCRVSVKDCPHRPCVLHTEAKPIAENRLRALHQMGINAAKTRCAGEFAPRDPVTGEVIGHDLTDPANVYIAPKTGERKCRPCQKERMARWYRRSKLLKAQAKERELRDAGHLELTGS